MRRATALLTQPPGTSWKGFVRGGSEGPSCWSAFGSVRLPNATGARVLQRSSSSGTPLPSSLSLARRGFHKRHSPSSSLLDRSHHLSAKRWQNVVVLLPPFHHRNEQDTKSDASSRLFIAKRGLSFFGAKRQEKDMVNPHGEVLVYQSPPAGIDRVVWVGLCAQMGLAIASAPYIVLSHLDQMALWVGVSGGMLAFSLLSLSLVRYAFKRKVRSIHAPASLLASSPTPTSTSTGVHGESNNEEGPLVRVTRWQHPFKQREELVPVKELQGRCFLAMNGAVYVAYPDSSKLRYIVQRDGFVHNADLFAKIFPVAAQAAAVSLNADGAQRSAEYYKAFIPPPAASAASPSPSASSTTTAASTTQSSPPGGARKTHHKGKRQK